ncbi:MAG: hypothetical protein ACK53A_03860 [Gemmatimonadota bacterium]|jgi:hypothetical protein|nr:hypothetical protein [Gemmatimonadota bacterium]
MTAIPMSLPAVVRAGEQPSAPTIARPDAASLLGLEAAALTLMANGMSGTAERLFARLADGAVDGALWEGRATLARETHRADAMAREAATPGFVPVPSAQRQPDGTPRFVLLVGESCVATREGAERFTAELGGAGVDAELRHFLDAALDGSNGFIDWQPGEGYGVLAAATAPCRPVAVVARVASEHRDGLERSIALAAAGDRVALCGADAVTLDDVVAASPAPMLHVRAGSAADVPALLATGRDAVHAGRIASVLWSVPAASGLRGTAEQVAATVLSVLGFAHFAVVAGAEGAELALFGEAPEGQTLVVSVSPAYLASQLPGH